MSFWYLQFSQKTNEKFDFATMVHQVEINWPLMLIRNQRKRKLCTCWMLLQRKSFNHLIFGGFFHRLAQSRCDFTEPRPWWKAQRFRQHSSWRLHWRQESNGARQSLRRLLWCHIKGMTFLPNGRLLSYSQSFAKVLFTHRYTW